MTQDSQQLLRLFGRLLNQRGFVQSAVWTLRTSRHEGEAPRGQLRVLRLFAEKGQMTNSDIVEALDIRPSSASAMVAKLVASGLIARTPSDEDGRVQLLTLTAAGRSFIEGARDEKDQLADKMFAGLTPDEQAQLTGLLLKLVTSLEAGDQDEMADAYFAKLGQFGPRHHGPRGPRWHGGPDRGFGGRPEFGGRPHGPGSRPDSHRNDELAD